MGNPKTAESTMEAAKNWVRTIQLIPVVTRKDIMGFTVNRIWRAVKKEVLFLLDRGYADPEDIDRGFMLSYNTPAGPCGMMDQIGFDTIQKIELRYYAASGDERDQPPKILNDLVAAGHLGEKTGKGFYLYPPAPYKQPGWLHMEPPWSPNKKVNPT